MFRKLTLFLLALIPFALQAQLATGSWRIYPAFGIPDRLIDTPEIVYLATSGSLHSYDKVNDETRVYTPGTDLGGNRVKDIYYNFDSRYLLVAYEDANIDILPDNGERINLPDVRDANVNLIKEINDVKFDDGCIYVATSFGLVVYDESRWEVKESGIFEYPVLNIAFTPENLLLVTYPAQWDYRLMTSPKTERHNRADKFTMLNQFPSRPYDLVALESGDVDGTHYAVRASNKKVYHLSIAANNRSASIIDTGIAGASLIFPANDDVYVMDETKIHRITAPWKEVESHTIPTPLAGHAISTNSDLKSLWAADINGLGQYRLEDDGTLTVTRDKYRPADATTFSDISHIIPLPDNRGFMISNHGMNANLAVGNGDFYDLEFSGNRMEDGVITNIEATENITFSFNTSNYVRPTYGDRIFSPTSLLEDPDDSSIHYVGSGNEGLYVIKDGRQIGKFDNSNSPMHPQGTWAIRVTSLQLDPKGNLLVGVYTENAAKSPLIVLPADKRRKDPSTITSDDWVALDMGGHIKLRDNVFHQCKKVPVIFMIDAQYKSGFSALHYGSSLTDTSDDTPLVISTLTDQDGKIFSPDYLLCFAEDSRGRVWIGTTQGIMEISNPTKVFSTDFNINRLKVPRNDGTNLADYLLESETIYAIAVDAADRKWIATAESGVYLVSENGDEILANFNTTNSPLATNCITDVYVDPNSNSVFFSTLNGLYEYSATASPARPDYSDVIAYPNPVTPDYTGLITIRGLMDSSLVKIMDSGMHLVYQTKSEGGLATWDGCTLSGARVKSGVYYVLASVSSETDSQGDVVAKILVVN
ncbi:MAG: hypothetical protein NC411_06530 [Bacteroides sp.]|nr:hypothetical protein [Bacteroides sp.]